MRVVAWVFAMIIAAVSSVPAAAVTAAPAATLVADLHPTGGSGPQGLTRLGQSVLFSATDGAHGRELWVTDGTSLGTHLVRDIRPGSGGSAPRSLTRVGKQLYFSANDGSHGRELWVSDGTSKGTRLVKDLTTGTQGSGELQIVGLGGSAYFSRQYQDLWRTNGTAATTRIVRMFKDIDLGGSAVMRSKLYFSADGALLKTDGTGSGTRRISPKWLDVAGLTRFGRHLFWAGAIYPLAAASTVDTGPGLFPPSLWWTDGTRSGTGKIGAINATEPFAVLGGAVYFDGWTNGSGVRLYRSDGTRAGTGKIVPRVAPLPEMQKHVGSLWTTTSSRSLPWRDELWVSDATAAGTFLVRGGTAGWFTSDDTLESIGLDGRLWFAAGPGEDDGTEWKLLDHELWSSDGTTAGTIEAVDINPTGSSDPRDFVKLGDALLFGANDGEHGRELWMVTP